VNCGFEWMAPLARAEWVRYPDGRTALVTELPQRCCLAPNHGGPHRSLSNVTTQASATRTEPNR